MKMRLRAVSVVTFALMMLGTGFISRAHAECAAMLSSSPYHLRAHL